MYRHILVAIDPSSEAETVIAKAMAQPRANVARVTLIHVQEPVGYAYGGDIPLDLSEVTESLREQAETQMKKLAQKAGLDSRNCELRFGRPATEIHNFASDNDVDLIVIGSHGRSGLQLLLGSTANSVLHGAPCDVLAVRIGRSD